MSLPTFRVKVLPSLPGCLVPRGPLGPSVLPGLPGLLELLVLPGLPGAKALLGLLAQWVAIPS